MKLRYIFLVGIAASVSLTSAVATLDQRPVCIELAALMSEVGNNQAALRRLSQSPIASNCPVEAARLRRLLALSASPCPPPPKLIPNRKGLNTHLCQVL
jgi:hypothetical protein